MTPEGKELSDVTAWLKAAKLPFIRMALMPGVPRGWPDLLILTPGVPIWIEMKAPGKKPAPLQYRRLETLRLFGYIHGWFDNAPAAIDFITRNTNILLQSWNAAGGANLSDLGSLELYGEGGGVPDDT